jgi:hypothetical protein
MKEKEEKKNREVHGWGGGFEFQQIFTTNRVSII